jgi:C4-dicarboxylate transporter DctM subunit
VKAAVDDEDISVWQIFHSSTPYWVIMLIGVVMLVLFPKIATWLPSLAF